MVRLLDILALKNKLITKFIAIRNIKVLFALLPNVYKSDDFLRLYALEQMETKTKHSSVNTDKPTMELQNPYVIDDANIKLPYQSASMKNPSLKSLKKKKKIVYTES